MGFKGWDAAAAKKADKPRNLAQIERKPTQHTSVTAAPNEALSEQKKQQARHRRKQAGQRRQERAVAAQAKRETVYFQIGRGGSTLETFKAFHLQPEQVARLREVVLTEMGGKPC